MRSHQIIKVVSVVLNDGNMRFNHTELILILVTVNSFICSALFLAGRSRKTSHMLKIN